MAHHARLNWRSPRLAALALLAALVGGCAEHGAPPSDVRPVRVVRVGASTAGVETTYAGEVKARHEARLSFRVPGKVITRLVEVGDRVREGQLLAQVDPTDYELAAKAITSQLAAARAERDLAKDDLARYRGLLDRKFISQAEYDRRATAHKTSEDRAASLEALLSQARNQVAYTRLIADRRGVVIATAAEAGQFAAAGQAILTLARDDEVEVAISVPEDRVAALRPSTRVAVSLWTEGDRRLEGRIREISPAADPSTRTYGVKVSLGEGRERARIGMTATVHFPPLHAGKLTVPLTAVFQSQDTPGRTLVWVVDESSRSVKSVPVTLEAPTAGQHVVVGGLSAGQWVVSAGTSRLREGQPVTVLGEEKEQALRNIREPQAASIAPDRPRRAGT